MACMRAARPRRLPMEIASADEGKTVSANIGE